MYAGVCYTNGCQCIKSKQMVKQQMGSMKMRPLSVFFFFHGNERCASKQYCNLAVDYNAKKLRLSEEMVIVLECFTVWLAILYAVLGPLARILSGAGVTIRRNYGIQ